MKLWEAMKALCENPNKVFEAQMNEVWKARMTVEKGLGGYYNFQVFYGKRLIDQSLGGGAFNGNVALGLDWQLVKQPVTWQEAIEAWADGGNIKWVSPDSKLVRVYNQPHLNDNQRIAMRKNQVTTGTWYVED